MKISTNHCMALLISLILSPQIHAERLSIETDTLLFSYDPDEQFNMGYKLQLTGNRLLFQPNLSVWVDSQFSDYKPLPDITNSQAFSVNFLVQAKPGYRIDNHQVSVSGHTYSSYNTTANVNLSGPFNFTYQPIQNYGTLTAVGHSDTPLPNFTLSGGVSINATNYFAGYAPGPLLEQPIYDYVRTDDILGYEDAVYDDLGNLIGGIPIYRYEYAIIGYEQIETFYPFYQIDAGSAGLDDVVVDYKVSAVPLPATAWLFWSGLSLLGWANRKKFSLNWR
jgi:hypothetical protein